MKKIDYQFSTQTTTFYFDGDLSQVDKICDGARAIFVTDEHVHNSNKKKFAGRDVIILAPGEQHKTQDTLNSIIKQLIDLQADRTCWLIGVGGGVVTDITGYAGAVYMRGLKTGFVPTSILAMVDASIGGKNGIDVGVYKNLVGVIRQPQFLLYDYSFLRSLPKLEWVNGFAEIIKHAAIKDARMFAQLEENKITYFQKDKKALAALIERNAKIKSGVVQLDEFEKGDRKLLNFGHTLGHAIENMHNLPHGHAISIGMVVAARISERLEKFKDTERLAKLFGRYGLPASLDFDAAKAFEILTMDKKRDSDSMNYVLLQRIGRAVTRKIPLTELKNFIGQAT